jgi:hypothetical protein
MFFFCTFLLVSFFITNRKLFVFPEENFSFISARKSEHKSFEIGEKEREPALM